MANKFIVSLSPHVHGGDSVKRNMYGVIIALIPALLVSLLVFGVGAAIVTLTSVAACVFFEWAITKYILRRERSTVTDGSAAITGLLLAFNLPSNLPVWIVIIGALVAIGVGKMTFGGLGCNPFNPALVGRVFLLISFPVQMTSWPRAGQWAEYLDAETGATPLALMKQAIHGDADALSQLPSAWDMFIGNAPGCLGEISALALLLGLAYMLWKRIITWHIPVSILATVFVCSGLMHWANVRIARPAPAERRSDAGRHLHGYRLCDLAHDPQGDDYLRSGYRIPHGGNPRFRLVPRRHVVRHPDYERLYAAD